MVFICGVNEASESLGDQEYPAVCLYLVVLLYMSCSRSTDGCDARHGGGHVSEDAVLVAGRKNTGGTSGW